MQKTGQALTDPSFFNFKETMKKAFLVLGR